MITFQQFMEKVGDFGSYSKYKKPKEKCYGRKQYYSMLNKDVCAFKRKR
jgi:hypothetical protein